MRFPQGIGDTDSIVNLEEHFGKVVGTMKPVPPQDRYARLLRMGRGITGGLTSLPRGVFRFATHTESDAWEMNQMLKQAAKPNR